MKQIILILSLISMLFSEVIECNEENLKKLEQEYYISMEKVKYLKDLNMTQESERLLNYSMLVGLLYADCKNKIENFDQF